MCSRVDCPTCGKPTFVGCGRHIEEVLGDVPRAQRCQCRERGPGSAPPRGSSGGFGRPGMG